MSRLPLSFPEILVQGVRERAEVAKVGWGGAGEEDVRAGHVLFGILRGDRDGDSRGKEDDSMTSEGREEEDERGVQSKVRRAAKERATARTFGREYGEDRRSPSLQF